MGIFDFFKKKGNSVVWRDNKGRIYCPGDSCPKDCDDSCPVWCASKAAVLLQRTNNIEKAIEEYKKAVSLAPDFKDAWSNLGSCYGQLNNHIEAKRAFSVAYEIDYSYSNAIYGLIISCKNLGQYEEALKYCDIYGQVVNQSDAERLRSQVLDAQKKNSVNRYDNDITMALNIIGHAREMGILVPNDGFPHIPEIMSDRKQVCAKVYDAGLHNLGGKPTPLFWVESGVYAGIGAVHFWNADWQSLKEIGIAETLLDIDEPSNMTYYVLECLGFEYDTEEYEEFTNSIADLSHWVVDKYKNHFSDENDENNVIEIMCAMYLFGMVFQMERLGMR